MHRPLMKRSDIEIMAPAGSWESLHAAIQGGADSVYFGVEKLNMRARSSDNFTTGDLPAIVALCREHGLKSYLTLNIVLFDEEINEMRELLAAAASAGVTAVIATDQAAIMAAREAGMEIHLSTQLNISNAGSLKFYSQWADVAVLSRELNLEQVRKIYDPSSAMTSGARAEIMSGSRCSSTGHSACQYQANAT